MRACLISFLFILSSVSWGEPSYQPIGLDLPLSEGHVDVLNIPQGGYAIAQPKEYKYMNTLGIGPCIAVSFYDPDSHYTLLSHFDAGINTKPELLKIFKEFVSISKARPNRIQVTIVGGWKRWKISERQALEIQSIVKKLGLKISFSKIIRNTRMNPPHLWQLPPPDPSPDDDEMYSSIEINMQTGELSTLSEEAARNSPVSVYLNRMSLDSTPLLTRIK